MPDHPARTRLFIASTPMMALACAGAALAQPGRSELVLIGDFPGVRRLQAWLAGWRDLPFQAVHRLPGRLLEQRAAALGRPRLACKRRLRRQTLPALRHLDARLQPDEVWVGNDRKPETQLALHLASRRLGRPAGHYLDDGLYSYLGDVRQRPLARRIDTLAKRLAYGRWWQRAPHAGGSRWMARHWLALPGQGTAYPVASRRKLPRRWYDNPAMRRLALAALHQCGLTRRQLHGIDILLVVPCSDRWPDPRRWRERLQAALGSLQRPGLRLAVKFHPRQDRRHLAGIGIAGAIELPALLPLELLLPLLPAGIRLLGEGSSALLGARWLRPGLAVAVLALEPDQARRGGTAPPRARARLTGAADRYGRRAAELFHGQGIGCFPGPAMPATGPVPVAAPDAGGS